MINQRRRRNRRAQRGVRAGAALCAVLVVAAGSSPASAYPRHGWTERVSVASDGTQADGVSLRPAISAEGRYVAFASDASNLVPGDTNGAQDVFVHDRETGTTERVSVASDGTEGNGSSHWPSISADGHHVAFHSFASNLVPGDTNGAQDVFVHDREAGTTERVSVASDGAQGNGHSAGASISADGRYVAFTSDASNLVPGDTNSAQDVFVHDRETGTTERVSVASDGAEGNSLSSQSSVSADGRFVAFTSDASNLVPGDDNEAGDVFVRDRETGTTERVSVPTDGADGEDASMHPSGGYSSAPRISADGRYVAFYGQATHLVPGDTNGARDVFVRDRETGVTERVSVTSSGAEGAGASWEPSISADGRYVAFTSTASNLVAGVGGLTVYVHDRKTRATEPLATASNGAAGNSSASWASISADGSFVAFESHAHNLVPGDTNALQDVFVRDRGRPVEVGALSTFHQEGKVTVTGWATLSGQELTSVTRPADEGLSGPALAGAELTGASITYRPENEDILVRLRVPSLLRNRQGCVGAAFCENTGAGAPAVLYALEFDMESFRYEVRALRSATTSPRADPHFALYRCTVVCVEEPGASGGIGASGEEVVISVPLAALGSPMLITGVRAFTAVGEAEPGSSLLTASAPPVPVDELQLPDATFPARSVWLGTAPAGTAVDDVPFDTWAPLNQGAFVGILDPSSLPSGDYEVWARACLGQECGAASVRVEA